MKRTLLPLLLFALACGDGNLLQPDQNMGITPHGPPTVLAADHHAVEKWTFQTDVTFVGPVIGDLTPHVTPSGVIHAGYTVNHFRMDSEDIVGDWYFKGKYHINMENGKGRSIGGTILGEITWSKIGKVGTFECVGAYKIENYPDPAAFIQYGNVSGCQGTGDFEGMKMKGYLTNEANPGLGFATIYDFTGEIW